MLIVTDRTAVDAAFEAASPRPLRELVLEVYPDAVEDANGRFHAPHDGYECPITGNIYRGGEYLPVDDPDQSYRVMGSAHNPPTAVDGTGEVVRWSGTQAQELAAWGVLIAQTRAVEAATSRHVGEVGKMAELHDLTVQFVKGFPGFYGTKWLHVMKDPSGNVVVYMGTKRLATGKRMGRLIEAQKGDRLSLRCKVKEHSVRESVAQTLVERPKELW